MKTMTLVSDSATLSGQYEMVDGVLWIHLNGRNYVYEPVEKSGRTRKGRAAASDADIVAPMPGKVTKVHVTAGDTVKAHQVLIVLEAMKMEYSLKASVAGTIAAVKSKAGAQVALGEVLITFEK